MGLIERIRGVKTGAGPAADIAAGPPARRAGDAPPPRPARAPVDMPPLLAQLESDIFLTMRIITHAAARVHERIEESMAADSEIRLASEELSALSASARDAALQLARTTDRLAQSTGFIQRSIVGADHFIATARQLTDEGQAAAGRLGVEMDGIGSVVGVIAALARQTNLLALNAGLEASRAGPAGRGFAVIANEIKALAEQAEKATGGVRRQVSDIQLVAQESARTIGKISTLISRIDPVISAVKSAVGEQIAGTADVAGSAAQSKSFADKVALGSARAAGIAEKGAAANVKAERSHVQMTTSLERLTQRSVVFLRHAQVGDRRAHQRVPVKIPCSITLGGEKRDILALDISAGGALLIGEGLNVRPGSMARLSMQNIGVIPVTIVAQSDLGLHARFDIVTGEVTGRIERLIAQVHVESGPRIELVRAAAQETQDAFEYGVLHNEVTVADLISANYLPIDGTDPVQYSTSALSFYDRVLPTIMNRHRASPLKPLFVLPVDVNSYNPVHHPEFSVRQRRNDPEWNELNSRNRSILERSQTLVGARNKEPYNMRAYTRHLRDGTFSPIINIVAPIFVNGRLWGNIQAGFDY